MFLALCVQILDGVVCSSFPARILEKRMGPFIFPHPQTVSQTEFFYYGKSRNQEVKLQIKTC